MSSKGDRLAFTPDMGADRLNTDSRPRMGSLWLLGITGERGEMEQRKNPRVQKMWETAGVGRRQKDNSEGMQRERIDRMPLILCSRKERRVTEGGGGSMIDVRRGREEVLFGGLELKRKRVFVRTVHMPSVSPLSASEFTY